MMSEIVGGLVGIVVGGVLVWYVILPFLYWMDEQ
jgi:hypothetical protein